MSTGTCGSSLLVNLPDDIIVIIGRSLSPRDICNLGLCCKSLNSLAISDKIWLTQCEMFGVVSPQDLVEWRKAVLSYKALCRFLTSVKSLLGIWVHQNPELGNVVYVMPGFVSVVGCRIIPQELGPLGIEDGPILWAPVFEVIGDDRGAIMFVLHGRDKDHDYLYPGSVKSVEKTCNVLLLEVEPIRDGKRCNLRKTFDHIDDNKSSRKVYKSESWNSKSQRFTEPSAITVPFSKLSFGDRRKLLELVTSQARVQVPDSTNTPLFPCLRNDEDSFQKDIALLIERRAMLIKMHRLSGECIDWSTNHEELHSLPNQIDLSEIKKVLDRSSGFRNSLSGDDTRTQCARKKTLGEYVRDYTRQMLRRSSSMNSNHGFKKNSSSTSENKHAQLHEFLSSGDTIGLTLHASTMKLSSYRAWPNMHDSRFALYKLPIRAPTKGQDYAGLWGGTFGWPPGKPTEDKPGKALFLLVLSYYEESPGQKVLIATKILEGTHYVLHPNGSAMFIVNINEASDEPFPWEVGANSLPITVEQSFHGEGIANGYGFRYPGSKPGSLFVLEDGMLAFIWKESRAVLTLQRLNLEDLLKKGERVPALSPITNFSYLTKSYSNVFAGFGDITTSLNSPRYLNN